MNNGVCKQINKMFFLSIDRSIQCNDIKLYTSLSSTKVECHPLSLYFTIYQRGLRGRDHVVLTLTTTYATVPITTLVVSLNPAHGEMHLIQYFMIKFASDLRQVDDFLLVPRFPPPIKLTLSSTQNYHPSFLTFCLHI